MWSLFTLIFAIFPIISGDIEDLYPQCRLPLHHGIQNCTNSSSIRFHLDTATETCLAFKYSGCGGNENNFETVSSCYGCFPMDYFLCPMGSKPIANADKSTICGMDTGKNCTGKDTYCQNGAFFGTCCNKTIRDKQFSDENIEKGCGSGQKKAQFDAGGYNSTLLGKSCLSNFCPKNSTCHQGHFFAYCCI